MGKSELAAAVALLLTCGDGEERAEVYGCAADRQQASIVFEVAADMVRMCPALSKRVKILSATKRIVYIPTNSFYQVLSAEAYSKHGFNIHGGGDKKIERLHTSIAGALGHNIKEFSVRLRMKLIKDNAVNVEAVLGVGFGRKDLIKTVCGNIYNPLCGG